MSAVLKRALIYGAGNNFIYSAGELLRRYEIVGVADGAESKQGTRLFGYPVGRIGDHAKQDYDVVIVTPSYAESIRQMLLDESIPEEKILPLEDALRDDPDQGALRMAVIFYGGLGDYIIGKNWLYHLHTYVNLEDTVIDACFSENTLENARAVFADSTLIHAVRAIDTVDFGLVDSREYSLILRFSVFPMVQEMDDRALYARHPKLYAYCSGVRDFGAQFVHRGFFASPDFYRTMTAVFERFPGKKYHALYDILENLKDPEAYLCSYGIGINEEEYLVSTGLSPKKFITVNTGANEEYTRKPSTRTWRHDNWVNLISVLRRRLPAGMLIVRMGLGGADTGTTAADLDLCGRTSVEQAKVLLKNAALHIDYEGGLVHLRHVLGGGVSIVLHGPTSVERYGYEENRAIRTKDCPVACEWSQRDWLTVCHNSNAQFACMRSVLPETVAGEVIDALKGMINEG